MIETRHLKNVVIFIKKILRFVLSRKLQIVFECQTRLSNSFRYKYPIPKGLISGVIYKFQTLRYKIWGTDRCVTSHWKEGHTIK